MNIIPLGTNGFFPSFDRQTACYAIPYRDTLIILDAGSGLFRLAEPVGQRLLKKAKKIHLYLSHYHLDHTLGFYAAFVLFKGKPVTVFGKEIKKVFSELVRLDYFPVDFKKTHANFSFKKLKPGRYRKENYTVYVRQQSHRGQGSLAFRLAFNHQQVRARQHRGGRLNPEKDRGRSHDSTEMKLTSIAYVTDTEPSKEGINFVKQVDLLLHEHGKLGLNKKKFIKYDQAEGHVTTAGAAFIAKEAKVKKLYLIHHNSFISTNKLRKAHLRLARSIFLSSYLSQDLKPISIP